MTSELRTETSRALAQAIAYRDCGKCREAEAAAMRLIARLVGAGILPPGFTCDRGER